MSRHDSAPTYSWVLTSQINKWLSLAFMVLAIMALIVFVTIKSVVDHNCQDYYKRTLRLGGYWLHVESGSTKDTCPDPWKAAR